MCPGYSQGGRRVWLFTQAHRQRNRHETGFDSLRLGVDSLTARRPATSVSPKDAMHRAETAIASSFSCTRTLRRTPTRLSMPISSEQMFLYPSSKRLFYSYITTSDKMKNRVIYSHNGGQYDLFPIMERMLARGSFPRMILNGRKVFTASFAHSKNTARRKCRIHFKVRRIRNTFRGPSYSL